LQPIIRVDNVHHTYHPQTDHAVNALRGVNLAVGKGEYLVILGANGSGKSTLARHLNALLLPTSGDVWVKEWNTHDRRRTRDIRAAVGMVFQTPDNQLVATLVEDDVAFGPENLGVHHPDLGRRVDWALAQVDMVEMRQRAPHTLSGGQKQRVAIAGVLAMQPEVLILDESTAMLDPQGRQEVLETAQRLNRDQGVTVIAITHLMSEAVHADRVVVMAAGQIVLEGTPRELFQQVEQLRSLQLDVPPVTELALRLRAYRPGFPTDLLSVDELVDAVAQRLSPSRSADPAPVAPTAAGDPPAAPLILVEHLAHDYMRGTPLQVRALEEINLAVYPGEIVGIIGHTGSGKSTVIQLFNGLLRPQAGTVMVLDQDMGNAQVEMRAIRRRVGLVFQFPEAQLFERYVGDDVAFGPRNLKLPREEVRARVRRAMEAVGLGFEEFKDRMTFSLSGGQLRRVALAGVLALEPEVLALDEPTAGLDPQGRRRLLDHIRALHEQGMTLVYVSHNLEDVAALCNRVYVIEGGRTVLVGTPAEIFGRPDDLRRHGLDAPVAAAVMEQLAARGISPSTGPVYTIEQAAVVLGDLLENKL
jgi:energy-coupling factor transport system ATP-binding protein